MIGIRDFLNKPPRQSRLSLTWSKGPGFSGQNKELGFVNTKDMLKRQWKAKQFIFNFRIQILDLKGAKYG